MSREKKLQWALDEEHEKLRRRGLELAEVDYGAIAQRITDKLGSPVVVFPIPTTTVANRGMQLDGYYVPTVKK